MADIQSNIKFNIDTSDAMASIKALQAQISAFQTQMSRGSAAQVKEARNLQRTLIDNINATGKFNASLTTIKTTTESFTTSLEKNKLSMREYFRYAGGASKSFGKFFKGEFETINKVARERVKDLQTQYIQLGRDANGAMQSIRVRPLILDLENMGTKTAIAAQKQALLNQLLKQGSTNLLNFGKNTQWAGRQLMVGFTIPLGIMGSAAAKSFMEMEQATIKFQRVYGDLSTTVQESNAMVGTIKELASEFTKYGVSFKDTMTLAADAAAMGKMGSELVQQVTETNRLAVLGNVEQGAALQTTTSLMDAFGTSAENLGEKINFLNAVENQTVTSIEDLTTAIPKAGPVIKQLGGSVEDLAFFLTAMREGGINASEGANALKSGLASLINPTQKASDFLARFKINITELVESNKGDVKGLVLDFAEALKTLDPLNRARAIEQLFGKFQFARMSTLFQNVIAEGSQASKVLELTNATATELGMLAGREMKKLADSPMYKFQKAVADIQAQLAPVGEEFLKAITPIIEFGTKVLDWFNGLEAGTKQFIVNFVGIVGGIGPILLMTFGLIANGAANIIKLFALMKNGFNKLGGSSKDLASQTQYMTTEQIEAAAIASSLDQAHNKLRQTFTLEAGALDQLTAAYQRNIAASGMKPVVPGGIRKFANGGMIMGPGTGTSDSIPAMVSNGEYITNAKQTKKYFPLLQAISKDQVPGYASPNGGSLIGSYGKGFRNATVYMPESMNTIMGGHSGPGARTEDVLQYLREAGGAAMSPLLATIAKEMGLKLNDPALIKEWEAVANTFSESAIQAVSGSSKEFLKDADIEEMLVPAFKDAAKKIKVAGRSITDALDNTIDNIYTVGQVGTQSGAKGGVGRVAIDSKSYKRQGRFAQIFAERMNPEMFGRHEVPSRSRGTKNLFRTKNPTTGQWEMATMAHITSSITTSTRNLIERTSTYVKNAAAKIIKATSQATVEGVKEETKTASPSREATNTGKNIGSGFIDGAESQVDDARAAGQQIGNAVVNGVTSGGVSGKARRAQAGQGPAVVIAPSGTQSGGKRRATRPGDLEARQAAQGAAMPAATGNALSGKSAKQLKAARRKVAFNQIKSGKVNIGGKISGGGFGVGAVAGTAAMFAPPEMQGILGTISMASSFIGMFGGVIGKIVPLLLRFAGPIGIAITVISGLVWAFGELDKIAKERIANEKALNNSIKMSAEGIKSAAEFFGTTAKERIGTGAGILAPNAGSAGRSTIAKNLLETTDFKKDNAKQIDALKRLNMADAQRALAGMAADFSSLGFGEEAVQAMVDAMVMAAGRKDVTLDFKSINIVSKRGRAGQQKEIQKILDQQLAKVNINDITQETRKSTYGSAYTVNVARNKQEMQALYDAGKLVANQFSSLQEAFNDGTISLKDYNAQFANLTQKLKAIPNATNKFTIMRAAIRSMNPEMAAFTKGIKDSATLAKVLQATMLGLQVPRDVMFALNADLNKALTLSSAIAAANAKENAKKVLDKMIADALAAQKLINDSFVTPIDPTDSSKGTAQDKIAARLRMIEIQEQRINDKYDERKKALDEVRKVQEQISAQQRDQLDLADALTKGDIAAAARAAQQMRANNAARALENQQNALDAAQKAEIGALVDPVGKRSRQYLENVQLQDEISKLYDLFGMKAPKFGQPTALSTNIPTSGSGQPIINNVNNSSPVYNINVSAGSNASASDIANIVTEKIKSVNAQQLKGSRFE